MGCGRTVGIVSPRRISRAGGAIVWANWCRSRRECVGELVQVDGSEHWWFEGRGPQCTLLVFVDDATSRLNAIAVLPEKSFIRGVPFWLPICARDGQPT